MLKDFNKIGKFKEYSFNWGLKFIDLIVLKYFGFRIKYAKLKNHNLSMIQLITTNFSIFYKLEKKYFIKLGITTKKIIFRFFFLL